MCEVADQLLNLFAASGPVVAARSAFGAQSLLKVACAMGERHYKIQLLSEKGIAVTVQCA